MLSLPKTYENGEILTEADLDNLRSPLLTLLNTTRLDDSFLNLDQVVASLIPAQKSLLVSKFGSTQSNTFVGKADDDGANRIRNKLPSTLIEEQVIWSTDGFVNNSTGLVTTYQFVVPPFTEGVWLVSLKYTTQLDQAITPTDGATSLNVRTRWNPASTTNNTNTPTIGNPVHVSRDISIVTQTIGFTQGYNVTSGSRDGAHSMTFMIFPEKFTNDNQRTLRLQLNVDRTSGLDVQFSFLMSTRVQYRRIW
jgi:hypothetical protein